MKPSTTNEFFLRLPTGDYFATCYGAYSVLRIDSRSGDNEPTNVTLFFASDAEERDVSVSADSLDSLNEKLNEHGLAVDSASEWQEFSLIVDRRFVARHLTPIKTVGSETSSTFSLLHKSSM